MLVPEVGFGQTFLIWLFIWAASVYLLRKEHDLTLEYVEINGSVIKNKQEFTEITDILLDG